MGSMLPTAWLLLAYAAYQVQTLLARFPGRWFPVPCAGGGPMAAATQHEHEMELTGSSESGAEEWFCPRCGRRLLVRWRPAFQKLVLDRGDERARHAGAKGPVGVGAVEVRPPNFTALPDGQARWLAENGIDWNSGAPGCTDR